MAERETTSRHELVDTRTDDMRRDEVDWFKEPDEVRLVLARDRRRSVGSIAEPDRDDTLDR